jgi:hypothetical protein
MISHALPVEPLDSLLYAWLARVGGEGRNQ